MARPDPTAGDGVVRSFPTVFRGFDHAAVRSHLEQVAATIASLRSEVADLSQQLAEARALPRQPAALDEATLMARLGEEAARLLTTAREGAAQVKSRAEERVAELLRDAQADAARIREEAELEAARLRQAATAAAEAEVHEAKQQGRAMLAEAQAVRERVLTDLSARRKRRLAQLETLRHGRDRLLDAYDHVERSLAEARSVLADADPEDREVSMSEPPTGEVAVVVATTSAAVPAPVAETGADEQTAGRSAAVATPDEPVVAAEPVAAAQAVPSPTEVTEDGVAAERGVDVDVVEPEAVAPAVDEPEAVAPAVDEPVAVAEPEPELVAEPVALAEPEGVVVAQPDAAPPGAAAGTEGAAVGVADDAGVPVPRDPSPVDDLFARLRAARVDAVARAHEVLDAAEPVSAEPVTAEPVGAEPAAAQVADLGRSLGRRLKRAMADEQNEVLDQLRRRKPGAIALSALPGGADRYRDAAEDDLWTAAVAGAESRGLDPLAAAASLDAGAVLDALLDEVVARVHDPLRERLARAVRDADDADDATAAARAVYREWKAQRIDAVAESLVADAHAQGARAGSVAATA